MIHVFSEDLMPKIHDYDIILVPMGLNNSFNSGFKSEIAANFNGIKKLEWELGGYGDRRRMGTISTSEMDGITFVFCYIDKGGYKGGDSIDYSALKRCLDLVKKRFQGQKIASPLLGFGRFEGNGDRDIIMGIFSDVFEHCDAVSLDIYIFESRDRKLEFFRRIAELRAKFKRREISSEEYSKARAKIEWERKHGIFKKMPDGYEYRPKNERRDDIITIKKDDFEK